MNGKSPISILQELMVAKKLPLPQYIEENLAFNYGCGNFKCTVKTDTGITGVGVASTKKAAKQKSAEDALRQMGIGQPPQTVVVEETYVIQRPFKNYVGDLNEYTTKRGVEYPQYETITNITSQGNQYIVKCSFMNKQTIGTGVNKKNAKQNAAKQMLQLLEKDNKTYLTVVRSKTTVENADIEKVMELYKNLSLNSIEQQPKKSVDNINVIQAAPVIKIDEEDSVNVLKAKLQDLGVEYTLTDFQTQPDFMVSLVINGTNCTFLENGKTREEAVKKILQKVLLVKKNGCSFNTDLISL